MPKYRWWYWSWNSCRELSRSRNINILHAKVSALERNLFLKIADKQHGLRLSAVLWALNMPWTKCWCGKWVLASPAIVTFRRLITKLFKMEELLFRSWNSWNEQNFIPAAYPEVYAVLLLRFRREEMETFHPRFLGSMRALPHGCSVHTPGGGYGTKTGTSQAAAFMTGAYAHEKFLHPQYTPDELFGESRLSFKAIFRSATSPWSDLPNSSQSGFLSALQALRMQEWTFGKQKPLLTCWIDDFDENRGDCPSLGEFFPNGMRFVFAFFSHSRKYFFFSVWSCKHLWITMTFLVNFFHSLKQNLFVASCVCHCSLKKEVPSVPEIFENMFFFDSCWILRSYEYLFCSIKRTACFFYSCTIPLASDFEIIFSRMKNKEDSIVKSLTSDWSSWKKNSSLSPNAHYWRSASLCAFENLVFLGVVCSFSRNTHESAGIARKHRSRNVTN